MLGCEVSTWGGHLTPLTFPLKHIRQIWKGHYEHGPHHEKCPADDDCEGAEEKNNPQRVNPQGFEVGEAEGIGIGFVPPDETRHNAEMDGARVRHAEFWHFVVWLVYDVVINSWWMMRVCDVEASDIRKTRGYVWIRREVCEAQAVANHTPYQVAHIQYSTVKMSATAQINSMAKVHKLTIKSTPI